MATDLIVETTPQSLVRKSLRNHQLVVLGPVTCFALGLFVPAGMDLGHAWWEAMLGSACIGTVLLVPIGSVFVAISIHRHAKVRENLPTVRLRGDRLSVQYGGSQLSADLRECRIRRRGPLWRMMLVWDNFNPYFARRRRGVRLWSWQPVILIELPPFGKTMLGSIASLNTVAVGYTDEMLERWESALDLPSSSHDVGWTTKLGDLFMVTPWASPGDGTSTFHRSQRPDPTVHEHANHQPHAIGRRTL